MMTIEGATTGNVFTTYIEHFLLPALKPGDCVVMDNLGAHRDARVKALLGQRGVRLVFQPAYSPDLNPIELAWSKLKWFLKLAKARSIDAINTAVAWAMDIINADRDAPNWFRHCGWPDGETRCSNL